MAMEYMALTVDEVASPVEQKLYVFEDPDYVLSDDETPQAGVTYYLGYDDDDDFSLYEEVDESEVTNPRLELLYEYDDNADIYVQSEDDEPVEGKTYYRYAADVIDYSGQTAPSDYLIVDVEDEAITNPMAEELFVYENGTYVRTQDTTPNMYTQYFRRIVQELVEVEEDDIEEDSLLYASVPTPNIIEEPYDGLAVESNEYAVAFTAFVVNPNASRLYEYVKSGNSGSFVMTSDTELQERKIYYERIVKSDYRSFAIPEGGTPALCGVFELVNGSYVVSTDATVVSGKTYYVYDPVEPEFDELGDPTDPAYMLGPEEAVFVADE